MILEVKDRRLYLNNLLSIMMTIHPNSDKVKLSDRQVKYLVESIILDLEEGITIGSRKNLEVLKEILEYKRDTSIYNLRSEIKAKGWISEDDYGYHYVSQLMKNQFDLTYVLKKKEEEQAHDNTDN